MKLWTNHSYLLMCYVHVTVLKVLLVLSKCYHHSLVMDRTPSPYIKQLSLGHALVSSGLCPLFSEPTPHLENLFTSPIIQNEEVICL